MSQVQHFVQNELEINKSIYCSGWYDQKYQHCNLDLLTFSVRKQFPNISKKELKSVVGEFSGFYQKKGRIIE